MSPASMRVWSRAPDTHGLSSANAGPSPWCCGGYGAGRWRHLTITKTDAGHHHADGHDRQGRQVVMTERADFLMPYAEEMVRSLIANSTITPRLTAFRNRKTEGVLQI